VPRGCKPQQSERATFPIRTFRKDFSRNDIPGRGANQRPGQELGTVWKESSQPAANIHEAWMSPFFGPGNPDSPIDLAVSENDPNLVYTTDFGRVLRTSDGGRNWYAVYSTRRDDGTLRGGDLKTPTNYGVTSIPSMPGGCFISYTDIGPFRSENGGESWTPAKDGIPPSGETPPTGWCSTLTSADECGSPPAGSTICPSPDMAQEIPSSWEGGICISEDGGRTCGCRVPGCRPSQPPTSCWIRRVPRMPACCTPLLLDGESISRRTVARLGL